MLSKADDNLHCNSPCRCDDFAGNGEFPQHSRKFSFETSAASGEWRGILGNFLPAITRPCNYRRRCAVRTAPAQLFLGACPSGDRASVKIIFGLGGFLVAVALRADPTYVW